MPNGVVKRVQVLACYLCAPGVVDTTSTKFLLSQEDTDNPRRRPTDEHVPVFNGRQRLEMFNKS